MELRERYDPEDIETLLSERGYDELLEEERAYVLRHLSGREEYEAMRALLLHVREGAHEDRPECTDPQVRTAVLEAFRSRKRSSMKTIWLNSIAAALWPKDGWAMWRPAVALASVALLLVGGWWFLGRSGSVGTNELAELKQEDAKEQQAIPSLHAPAREEMAPAEIGNTTTGAFDQASAAAGTVRVEEPLAETREDGTMFGVLADAVAPAPPPAVAGDRDIDSAPLSETAAMKAEERGTTMPTTGRTVTSEDMLRNYSLTNTSPDATRKEARAKVMTASGSSGRALANDEILLSLLNTGW
jgi:hypothetical protein